MATIELNPLHVRTFEVTAVEPVQFLTAITEARINECINFGVLSHDLGEKQLNFIRHGTGMRFIVKKQSRIGHDVVQQSRPQALPGEAVHEGLVARAIQ